MRPEGVVFFDGFLEFAANFVDGAGREVVVVIELFSEGAIGVLDAAIIFWSHGREDKEFDVALGAGLFELPHELGSAIDLDGCDFEKCFFDEFREESLCGGARGP